MIDGLHSYDEQIVLSLFVESAKSTGRFVLVTDWHDLIRIVFR